MHSSCGAPFTVVPQRTPKVRRPTSLTLVALPLFCITTADKICATTSSSVDSVPFPTRLNVLISRSAERFRLRALALLSRIMVRQVHRHRKKIALRTTSAENAGGTQPPKTVNCFEALLTERGTMIFAVGCLMTLAAISPPCALLMTSNLAADCQARLQLSSCPWAD